MCLAVRNAASDHDARLALERARDLARKTGLADARRPDDRGEPARRLAPSRRTPQRARRASASTDERRDDGARKGGHVGTQVQQLHAASEPTLPFGTDGDAARRRRRPDEAIGRLADEHPASGAACSSRAATLTVSPVTSFWSAAPSLTITFARVDAGTRRDPNAVPRARSVHAGEAFTHLERRSHCPNRIVFVHCGHAEHSHDRVADELLDRASRAVRASPASCRSNATSHAVATRSSRSPSAVEPTTSVKTTVTTFRVAASPGCASSRSPHVLQNRVGVVLTSTGTADHDVGPYAQVE